jgi:hypothetical protein
MKAYANAGSMTPTSSTSLARSSSARVSAERSDLSQWRKRLGAKLELLLAESLRVAHESGALRTKDLARVTVDTTVQRAALLEPDGVAPFAPRLKDQFDCQASSGVAAVLDEGLDRSRPCLHLVNGPTQVLTACPPTAFVWQRGEITVSSHHPS